MEAFADTARGDGNSPSLLTQPVGPYTSGLPPDIGHTPAAIRWHHEA